MTRGRDTEQQRFMAAAEYKAEMFEACRHLKGAALTKAKADIEARALRIEQGLEVFKRPGGNTRR